MHSPVTHSLGPISIGLHVPFAQFGHERLDWEAGQGDNTSWIDLALISGKTRTIDLRAVSDAAIAFALEISAAEDPIQPDSVTTDAGQLRLQWHALDLVVRSSDR